jgi:hypothetical protein
MAKQRALLGVYEYLDDLLAALKGFADRSLKVHTVYSPIARHEIFEALNVKPSPIRYFTLTGGILGVCTGVGLLVYTCLQWKFIVSGKPIVPLVPAVVVGFEFCILLGVLFNTFGMLLNTRLPKIRLPEHYDDRFMQDRFGVLVMCAEDELEGLSKIMKEAGAEEVREVEG